MTPAERARQLRRWYETMVEFERQCAAFIDLMMAHPESPFLRAINDMAGEYTTAVDPGGDCAWFWLECDLGARPKTCSTPAGVDHRIATIDDLIAFIEACGGGS